MLEVVELARSIGHDPANIELYRQVALDICTAGAADPKNIADPEFLELPLEERNAYLADIAEQLAPILMRATITWSLFETESVDHWRTRTGRSADADSN
jgi:hypothetical protein